MNILITLFEIQDYGGIAQSHELMYEGLRELGHNLDFVVLRPNDQPTYIRKAEGPAGSYPSVMPGAQVHTLHGWYGVTVMSYGSSRGIAAYRKLASGNDLVIHQIPVPKPDLAGRWKRLYDVDAKQIAWIHDANFRDLYPHLVLVADKLDGVTVSNQAGYVSAEWLPVPRAFLGVPHKILDWEGDGFWKRRKKQAVCAHVWKAWKRMHLAVEAIPHMKKRKGEIIMGGDGIEGRYMRSKEKCKPKYKGMWKRALRAGMDYRGLMTHDELFDLYHQSRAMIDLSFSKKFEKLGASHFNRSTLEALNCGLVPIVTDVNMHDEFGPQVELWEERSTHIEIPYESGPATIAEIVEETLNMNPAEAETIIDNGRYLLLEYFDHIRFAEGLIRLANGKSCGVYPKLETGEPPPGFATVAKTFAKKKAT